ncbi:MAG: flavoprotein [Opitutales bacterium]
MWFVDSPDNQLKGRTIVLGVTGSIAAYKAADLTSRLVEYGAEVFPVLTESAGRFIQPLTLQTLARNPAVSDLWAEEEGWQPGHIEIADRADLLLVAPATAHCIANFAHGQAPAGDEWKNVRTRSNTGEYGNFARTGIPICGSGSRSLGLWLRGSG